MYDVTNSLQMMLLFSKCLIIDWFTSLTVLKQFFRFVFFFWNFHLIDLWAFCFHFFNQDFLIIFFNQNFLLMFFIIMNQVHAIGQRREIFSFVIFWFIVKSTYQILNDWNFFVRFDFFVHNFFYFIWFFEISVVFDFYRIEIVRTFSVIWIVFFFSRLELCYWYYWMNFSFRRQF